MKIRRIENAKRNMVFGIVLKLYQILIAFFMRSFLVRCLGLQYLGLNSLFTSILQVLNLAELGVGSAMVFSMYKPIADNDNITICALMNLYKWYYRIIGSVILVIGCIITPFVPEMINGEVPKEINIYILYWMNLGATVLTYWLFAYRNSILQAYQRSDVVSKVTIIMDTVKYAIQVIVLWFCKNYYYYVIAILLTQAFANILTAIISRKMYSEYKAEGKLPKEMIKKINGRIKDLFTAKLGGIVVNSVDTIVISAFLGLQMLAIYQNYYYIMTSVIGMLTVLLGACTAGIGNSLITESMEKNYRDFRRFGLLVVWAAGICVCCFLNLYQPFMTLWMGEDKLLGQGSVVLICFYFYLYVFNQYLCTYKDAAGIWHEDRFRPIVGSIFNLTLNLLLVNRIGIFAIILSTVLTYLFVVIPWITHNLFSVLFKRSAADYVRWLLRVSCVVFLSSAVTYCLCLRFSDVNILSIVIRLIVSVVVSNSIYLVLLGKGDEYNGALEIIDRLTNGKLEKLLNIFLRKKS